MIESLHLSFKIIEYIILNFDLWSGAIDLQKLL